MREVVFVDFARTAFTNRGGALRSFSGTELGAACLKGLVNKSGIWEKDGEHAVEAVFAGSAFRSKDTFAPVRYMTQLAGFPVEIEGHQVEMQGGSAITSINHAAFQIALGYTDVAIAGGMESHSTRPAFMSTTTEPYKGLPPEWISLRLSPLDEQNNTIPEVSDAMAKKWGITREQCDEFALQSRQRLAEAYGSGLIGSEIVPVTVRGNKKRPDTIVSADVCSLGMAAEDLVRMTPLQADGVSTEGNLPELSDGAGFLLMMSAEKANELGFVPYAKWVMGADVGVEPRYMGIGPVFSNLKAMKLAGLSAADVDVWECNETSAAQNLAVIRETELQIGRSLDLCKWNPNGGALAIGDPYSASGARIAMFAMKQLEKSGGKYGVISACCAGGHGATAIIENLRR